MSSTQNKVAEEKLKTDHPDILIAKSRKLNFAEINEILSSMDNSLMQNDEKEALRTLKKLVPEFSVDPKNNIY